MSDQQRQTLMEVECDALCAWSESPKGCDFRQEIPGDIESITWTYDGTFRLTQQWMRAHSINEAATFPEELIPVLFHAP